MKSFVSILSSACVLGLLILWLVPVLSEQGQNQQPDPAALIKISVEGTSIDVMPQHTHVIVKDSQQASREALKHRLMTKSNLPDAVRLYGMLLTFSTTEHFPEHRVGDVIYTFIFDSIQGKEAFISKHKLQFSSTSTGKHGVRYTEYSSQPSYYVVLQTKKTKYICRAHRVIEDKKGKCKKCGKELEVMEVYE